MKLSHSALTGLLDDCAYRIGLKSIVKLPSPPNGRLAAGIAYHAAIELHERSRMDWYRTHGRKGSATGIPYSEALAVGIKAIQDVNVDWMRDELEPADAGRMLDASLTHWYNTPIPEGQAGAGGSLRDRVLRWRPLAIEGKFNIWTPPHTSLPVVGFLDVAYQDENKRIKLVDNKSANRFGKWRLDGEGIRDQPAMYCYAAMRSPSLPGRRDQIPDFEYHITRTSEGKNKSFQGARVVQIGVDEVDLEYIEDRLSRAHQQQLEGRWEKNPDTFFCSPQWCPFHQEAGGPCDPHGPPEFDIEAYRD